MFQVSLAKENIALARAALEEYGQGDVAEALFACSQIGRRGIFADIPLALSEAVMTLAGRGIVGDIELVPVKTNFTLNERASARVIRQAHGDLVFCHAISYRAAAFSGAAAVPRWRLKNSRVRGHEASSAGCR